MTRAFLQLCGSASAAIWAILMLGTLFSPPAVANTAPAPATSCQDCYVCNNNKDGCNYVGTGAGCKDILSCTCNPNNGNPICTGV